MVDKIKPEQISGDWDDSAKDWFSDSCILLNKIRAIKNNDSDTIESVIADFGIDIGDILKPHQKQALAMYILLGYSNNWGQMRTGKTPPTILYFWALWVKRMLMKQTDGVETILTVVPNTIKHTWWHEIHKFAGYQASTLSQVIEGPKSKKEELWRKFGAFKIVNYESLRADISIVREIFKNKDYGLILDECQAIKNWSKQTQALIYLCQDYPPKYMVSMTGTPVANKPEDVFNVVNLTAPLMLGNGKREFEARYCYLGGYTGNQIIGYKPEALKKIHDGMARCSVRALRKEVGMDLGKVIQPEYLDMPKDMKRAHDELRDQFITDLLGWEGESQVMVNNRLVQYMKLVEITSGFIYDNSGNVILTKDRDNVKIQWLDSFIAEYLDDIEKLVVFSNFVPVIKFLANRYAEHRPEVIYGEVNSKERDDATNRFRFGDSQIMICNIRCAPGLDFNPAMFSIFMNRDMQLLNNLQAEDRITGYNQVGEATIKPLLCNGSIDISLERLLAKKQERANIIQDGEHNAHLEGSFNITKDNLMELLNV